jgi:diadenosine tetraphosphate (Ap4A) HIT family hydrolase
MPAPSATVSCVFCDASHLSTVLTETANFRVVADHAPLVAGHTLVIPKEHFACYGAVPATLDAELAEVRARMTAFLTEAYGAVSWFEHGIFHQTVFHAHLHAMPFSSVTPSVVRDPTIEHHPIASRDDVRAWYAAHGPYVYLEEPDGAASIFAPREDHYFHVLRTLRERTPDRDFWLPPTQRYVEGQPKVQALVERWRAQTDRAGD